MKRRLLAFLVELHLAWLTIAAVVSDCLFLVLRTTKHARKFSVNTSLLLRQIAERQKRWHGLVS